jgi:DNA-binding FadR family transcriptional regulator
LVLATRLEMSPDAQLVDDLFEARKTIEVEVAALAAKRRQPEDITALGETIEQMRSIGGADRRAYGNLDLRFHHGLFVAAANPILRQMAWSTVETMVIAQGLASVPEALRHEDSQRGHETIFEAVRAGDSSLAREEVCRLLNIARDTLKRSLVIKRSLATASIGNWISTAERDLFLIGSERP